MSDHIPTTVESSALRASKILKERLPKVGDSSFTFAEIAEALSILQNEMTHRLNTEDQTRSDMLAQMESLRCQMRTAQRKHEKLLEYYDARGLKLKALEEEFREYRAKQNADESDIQMLSDLLRDSKVERQRLALLLIDTQSDLERLREERAKEQEAHKLLMEEQAIMVSDLLTDRNELQCTKDEEIRNLKQTIASLESLLDSQHPRAELVWDLEDTDAINQDSCRRVDDSAPPQWAIAEARGPSEDLDSDSDSNSDCSSNSADDELEQSWVVTGEPIAAPATQAVEPQYSVREVILRLREEFPLVPKEEMVKLVLFYEKEHLCRDILQAK